MESRGSAEASASVSATVSAAGLSSACRIGAVTNAPARAMALTAEIAPTATQSALVERRIGAEGLGRAESFMGDSWSRFSALIGVLLVGYGG